MGVKWVCDGCQGAVGRLSTQGPAGLLWTGERERMQRTADVAVSSLAAELRSGYVPQVGKPQLADQAAMLWPAAVGCCGVPPTWLCCCLRDEAVHQLRVRQLQHLEGGARGEPGGDAEALQHALLRSSRHGACGTAQQQGSDSSHQHYLTAQLAGRPPVAAGSRDRTCAREAPAPAACQ